MVVWCGVNGNQFKPVINFQFNWTSWDQLYTSCTGFSWIFYLVNYTQQSNVVGISKEWVIVIKTIILLGDWSVQCTSAQCVCTISAIFVINSYFACFLSPKMADKIDQFVHTTSYRFLNYISEPREKITNWDFILPKSFRWRQISSLLSQNVEN